MTHGGFGPRRRLSLQGFRSSWCPSVGTRPEVGRRAEASGAGVMLSPKRLSPDRLRDAVRTAVTLKPAAADLAARMAAEGGPSLAADRLEALHARSRAAG